MNLFGSLKKTIFLFCLGVILVFALLFYKEDRLKELLQVERPDHLSVLYLQLLLNMNPDDVDLRIQLARHYINMGELAEARAALEPLLARNGPEELDTRLLALEIDFKDYYSTGEDNSSRKTKLATLQNSVAEISKNQVPVALLPKVIKLNLELEQPSVVADLYYRWSASADDSSDRVAKLKESARWHMASEQPRKAADIYHECYELSEDVEQARQFAFLTIEALRAAGESQVALQYLGKYQQRFPEDPELLDEAINIYLASNDQRQAYETGARRLSLDPENPEQIRKQIDRALAVGELSMAVTLAQHIVELAPADENAHENLGRIAEWALMREIALKEWLWLARSRKDEPSIINTIRLSKALNSTGTALEMLIQLSGMRKLTNDEMNSVLSAYAEAGSLSEHVDFLRSYLDRYPDNPQVWEALAKIQENAGQLSGAIDTWRHIGAQFNRLPEALAQQGRLMWKNGQPEKAFSTLISSKGKVTEKDLSFWEVLGDISWELKRSDEALAAYGILWKSGSTSAIVAERLIQVTRDMGKFKESIAVGEEAYQRLDQPRWLLLSMDVSNQAGSPEQLKRLLKIAMKSESRFRDSEMYWLLHAQHNLHEKEPETALKDYRQALKVNPASGTAKEGILWNLIGADDKESLQAHIKTWRSEASKNPALWGVYGIALTKVGQNKEALPWLERKTRANPDDYLWLLTYADALGKSGHADKSWRLRKYILSSLRSRLNDVAKAPGKKIKDLLRPEYFALIRDLEGANADVSILKKLLAKGYDDPAVQELLVASYLSQENYPAARYWLLKEHISRQQSPAWQRLALALGENDLAAVENILENENDKLSEFNRMEAFRRLGRNEEALASTYKLLESHKQPSSLQTGLFNLRDDLVVKTSRQVASGFDFRTLGNINFLEGRSRFNMPYMRGVLGTEIKYINLGSTDPNIRLPATNEVDISLDYKHPLRQGTFQANVGGNIREVNSIPYGSVRISQDITQRVRASLRAGVSELSHETGALRALGKKDTLLLGVSAQLSQQMFANFEADGHRYSSRGGGELGKGYKLQGILGYSLLSGIQDWQVRLQGSWENNHLAQTLPSDLDGLLSPSLAQPATIVPRRFAMMGMGTSFRYGPPDQGILRRPFVLADVWSGYVWPADAIGYNGRISMGISILGPDILSASAFYSNVQGGRTNQPFAGAGLQYSFRF